MGAGTVGRGFGPDARPSDDRKKRLRAIDT
jgi:hypothetical protein